MIKVIYKKITFQINSVRLISNLDLTILHHVTDLKKTAITILINMFKSERRLDNIGRTGGKKLCTS